MKISSDSRVQFLQQWHRVRFYFQLHVHRQLCPHFWKCHIMTHILRGHSE